jgi:hypothetical protein
LVRVVLGVGGVVGGVGEESFCAAAALFHCR